MLDVIVLIAMAITAGAFAAGLTAEAGLPLLPVLIATMALFLVMATSYVMLGRAARGAGGARIEEIEEALEIIDSDLQRIDRVEDDVARLDLLSDRVERLDRALGGDGSSESPSGLASAEEPATEFAGVYERTESLRAEIETESSEETGGKVGLLKGLLARRSDDPTPETPSEAAVEDDDAWDAPSDPPIVKEVGEVEEVKVEIEEEQEPEAVIETVAELESETEIETEIETVVEEIEVETAEETVEEILEAEPKDESGSPSPLAGEEEDAAETAEAVEAIEAVEEAEAEVAEAEEVAELSDEPVTAAYVDDDDDDDKEEDAMRRTIREAVEAERVELYLQSTVTLPERKLRYFEALTRVRTADDDLVLPGEYVPVAKRAGMMPLIDNALLVKSVHTLQQVPEESEVQGLFCNISLHSLLDPDYFPELIEFMEENNSLSDRLIFEVSQPEMAGLTEAEFSCLDTLGALGYSFCLDNVGDLDADFASLSDRHFRYVKLSAAKFLDVPGRIAADLKRQLDGLGMQLIIEKVEDEGDVAELLDHGIDLAQGNLFDEPKPADDALVSQDAGAA